jgi:glutamyl-tRNA reductase
MNQAFSAAKRVRSETEVGRLAVSISYAAVELARKIFDGLEGKAVLLVGAGEMSELAARALVDHGALPLYVTNRTWSRAQELARALGGTAVPFDQLAITLSLVDIVVTSTAAPEPIVTAAQVRSTTWRTPSATTSTTCARWSRRTSRSGSARPCAPRPCSRARW